MIEWIKCSDRLPGLYDFVLVYATTLGTDEPKPITIARWNGKEWEFMANYIDKMGYGVYQDLEWEVDSTEITHWIELPEAPNE